MNADLLLTDDTHRRFLVDTKYKALDPEEKHAGLAQTDFYQMYAYGKAGRQRYDDVVLPYPIYTVTTFFGQKEAGGGYIILHLVQAKDRSWYVDKTLTDAQAGIDPTKQDYRPIQAPFQTWRTPVERTGPESNNEYRMAQSFYPWLTDRLDEPPPYLDDLGHTWWQRWYGNGQIRQLMGGQKIQCVAPCAPDQISQDAAHKVYRVTLQKVNASDPKKSIGESYSRDISFIKDAQGYWWIDSFDPITKS